MGPSVPRKAARCLQGCKAHDCVEAQVYGLFHVVGVCVIWRWGIFGMFLCCRCSISSRRFVPLYVSV